MSIPGVEDRSYSVARDGAAWCATAQDFINLQESLAGFGDTPLKALAELLTAEEAAEIERRKTIRRWICNACKTKFDRRHDGDGQTDGTGPACPTCKCCGQYTYEVRELSSPNYCAKCTPAGLGYCRCEVACND